MDRARIIALAQRAVKKQRPQLVEGSAPADPASRAVRRLDDAAKRGGFFKAIQALDRRIDKIAKRDKLEGVLKAVDQAVAQLGAARAKAASKLKGLT